MASTATEVAPRSLPALPANTGKVSLGGALRSEFTKIKSVRSTWWTLLALIVVMVGIGALACAGAAHAARNGHVTGLDPAQQSLFGVVLAQLIISVLGALTITSEFGTGMIRTSLTTLPRRGMFVAAKAIVFGVVAFGVSLVASFGAFFLGQALMSGQHLNTTLSHPGVLRAVVGAALYLTACGLLAFGLGLLIRHTAGAISAAVGLLFVLWVLFALVSSSLPVSWQDDITRWIPANAGTGIWETASPGPHMFAAWTGFAVFAIYAAVAIGAGMYLFRKRNA
jgi:ABC-2 type transport system permease protein